MAIRFHTNSGPAPDLSEAVFDLRPMAGETIILKSAGKRQFYRVTDIMHAIGLDGRMGAIVSLEWDGALSSSSVDTRQRLRLVIDNDDEEA